MTNLEIEQATLNYQHRTIFQELSVQFPVAKFTCILGSSGVGKTSLLRLIAGLDSWGATAVKRHINGESLSGKVSYLSQQSTLLPWLNVIDNVMLSHQLTGEKASLADEARAVGLLAQVGLADALNLKPAALSGGMQQRVMLARILFEQKPIVLLDEPFAALDVVTKCQMHELLLQCLQGKTVIMVTHDPLEALRLADQILLMQGNPAKLWRPFELHTAAPREVQSDMLAQQAELIRLLRETQ